MNGGRSSGGPEAAGTESSRYAQCHDHLGSFETHDAALQWIPSGARVLDVGCATGYFARRLVREKGCTIIGIEMDEAAGRAAAGVAERVHVGDLEDEDFLAGIDARVDVVFFGDILEHLADPRPVLRRARAWIDPGGRMVCSVPNVAYWKIRYELLRGRFNYSDVGILDRTYLRFYTRRSLEDLITETGFRILDVRAVCSDRNLLGGGTVPRGSRPSRIGAALARAWPGLFGTQYLIRAAPDGPASSGGGEVS